MRLPHKTLEKRLFDQGYQYIFAVDEVGVGSLAGPVTACAVGITNTFYKKHHKKLHWLRESKLLLPHQREKFAKELMQERGLVYAISHSYPKTIDKLNIYNAARLAMRQAIKNILPSLNLKSIVLVDGKTKIKGLDLEQKPIIKGDRKVFTIACASIIAKVIRDQLMIRYAKKYPNYCFEKHKGYGTKLHKKMLEQHGVSTIHRKSFKPVTKLL